jgi:hypothetical protein
MAFAQRRDNQQQSIAALKAVLPLAKAANAPQRPQKVENAKTPVFRRLNSRNPAGTRRCFTHFQINTKVYNLYIFEVLDTEIIFCCYI